MLCQWKEDVFDISKSNSYPSFYKDKKKRIEDEKLLTLKKSHCIPKRNVLVWKYFIPSLYGGCKM